jgi:UV DNA damage endonuclease
MKFRLGYVAMTKSLEDCSPSGTVTFTTYQKLSNVEAKRHRLHKTVEKNLLNTLRILRYNKALDIMVYRLTSKLIPLATHPELAGWNYTEEFSESLLEIGRFITENHFRVSAHPDHFTILNSPVQKVTDDSLRDLDYHVRLYEAMGLADTRYKLVMHVGGVYGGKCDAIERFCSNFTALPDRIRTRIIIENDDKSYNTFEVLDLCQRLGAPMVLDVHHHHCLCGDSRLEDVLPAVFDTWKGESLPPKIHFSSPKSCSDFRSHSDQINFDDFVSFLMLARKTNRDFDVMLEAKDKDLALLGLSETLAKTPGIRRINTGEFAMD